MWQEKARDLYLSQNWSQLFIDVLLVYLQVLSIHFNAGSMYAMG